MRINQYDEYKDSRRRWLGEVPAHWKIKPLWTLYRRTKRTGFENEELLSVYRDYGVIPKSSRDDNFNKPSEDLSPYQLVEPSDLVINKMKAWQGSVAVSEYRGIVSPAYHVFECLHCENSRYLHHLMRSPRYITGYLSISKGIRVNQWDLEPQQHSRMPILIPPPEEQIAIANFLDAETAKIDALVAEQQQLIELLKEKRQAVISHAVTKGLNPDAPLKDSGVEWLGEVPEHWGVKKIGWILCESPRNGASPQINSNGAIPTFSIAAVRDGLVDIENHIKYADITVEDAAQYFVKENDIFVLRGNGNKSLVGTAGIVSKLPPENCIYPDILIRIRPSASVSSWYLVSILNSLAMRPSIETVAQTASGVWKISGKSLQDLKIPIPPREEQIAIHHDCKQQTSITDALISESEQAIELLQERRTALISAAVTGKIDVREYAAQEIA